MLCVVPMKLRLPGEHRPMRPEARAGLGAAFVLLALISAIELADGTQPHYIGLLASAPFLVAAFAAWREVILVGGLATALGLLCGLFPEGLVMASAVQIGAIMAATAMGAVAGTVRAGQAERLAELSKLASVAQTAVLRPLGPQVGPLAVAGRYISASVAADIGGGPHQALGPPDRGPGIIRGRGGQGGRAGPAGPHALRARPHLAPGTGRPRRRPGPPGPAR